MLLNVPPAVSWALCGKRKLCGTGESELTGWCRASASTCIMPYRAVPSTPLLKMMLTFSLPCSFIVSELIKFFGDDTAHDGSLSLILTGLVTEAGR